MRKIVPKDNSPKPGQAPCPELPLNPKPWAPIPPPMPPAAAAARGGQPAGVVTAAEAWRAPPDSIEKADVAEHLGGVRPRRLTRQRAPRRGRVALCLVFRRLRARQFSGSMGGSRRRCRYGYYTNRVRERR